MKASLDLLRGDQRDRYFELAIFAEDTPVPRAVLDVYWGETAHMPSIEVERFCDELSDLSLGLNHRHSPPSVVLHDVLRSYVRSTLGQQFIKNTNRKLLDAIASAFDIDTGSVREWWKIPTQLAYLFRNLTYHLTEAERDDELNSLLTDLRWAAAQIRFGGPSAVAADLVKGTTSTVQALARAIGQMSHLLTPVSPQRSIEAILASRLAYNEELEPIVQRFSGQLTGTRLVNHRPLPDNPDPALWRTFTAPKAEVNAIAFAPDSGWIAAAGADLNDNAVVQIWDIQSGELIYEFRDSEMFTIQALVVSESGKRIAFADTVQEIRLAEISTKRCMTIHDPGKYEKAKVRLSSDGTWFTAIDYRKRIIAIRVGFSKESRTIPILYTSAITCVAISPDNNKVLSGHADGRLWMWTVGDARAQRLLARHSSDVCTIGIAPDGTWAVSGDKNGQMWIWDLESRRVVRVLDRHRGEPLSLVVEPSGKWIATADREYGVSLWDVETGNLLGHLNTLMVTVMSVTQDGRWLATGSSQDQAVRLWDVQRAIADRCDQQTSMSPYTAVAASHDGTWIAVGHADATVSLIDVQNGETRELTHARSRGPGYADSIVISLDDSWIIVPSTTEHSIAYQLDVWASGFRRVDLGHGGRVDSLTLGPDGSWLVSGSGGHFAYLTDMKSGATQRIFSGGGLSFTTLQPSPDGRWLAVADAAGVSLMNLRTGSIDTVLDHGGESIWAMTVSSNRNIIATYSGIGILRIWEFDRALLAAIQTDDIAECLTITTDGRYLAAGGANGGIFVVDMTARELVATMRVDGSVLDCVWLPGSLVLCAVGSGGVYYFKLILD